MLKKLKKLDRREKMWATKYPEAVCYSVSFPIALAVKYSWKSFGKYISKVVRVYRCAIVHSVLLKILIPCIEPKIERYVP